MRGILWKGDWPAEHHEEKNGKMCFETFFCVWLIGIEKWHWGAKKQVRTVKYMLSQSGKKYQKILIDFSTFLYMKNETIFVEFFTPVFWWFLPSDCSISTGHMQQNFASSDILEHWNRLGVRHSLKSQTIDSQNLVAYKKKINIQPDIKKEHFAF